MLGNKSVCSAGTGTSSGTTSAGSSATSREPSSVESGGRRVSGRYWIWCERRARAQTYLDNAANDAVSTDDYVANVQEALGLLVLGVKSAPPEAYPERHAVKKDLRTALDPCTWPRRPGRRAKGSGQIGMAQECVKLGAHDVRVPAAVLAALLRHSLQLGARRRSTVLK